MIAIMQIFTNAEQGSGDVFPKNDRDYILAMIVFTIAITRNAPAACTHAVFVRWPTRVPKFLGESRSGRAEDVSGNDSSVWSESSVNWKAYN